MTLTTGRIDRAGRVSFHDASLAVWEEGIADARDAGGWDGEQRWKREFKRDVFARIVQMLNRLGWTVGPGVHIRTGNDARYCRKGDLQADLHVSGRCIEFKMFQSVNAPDRPDYDGRYQRDQERHMPYLMRIEMERTRRRIRDYLLNVFTGYSYQPDRLKRGGSATALDHIAESYTESHHFKGDLANYTISAYNNRSADDCVVEHGARVWVEDRKGRIVTGTAYYNINSMWWVVMGRFDYTNVASFHLYVKRPDNLRVKRNSKLRRQRLEKEMAKAVEAMKFERAAVLRDVLFPGSPALYVVWHSEHGLYHREGFCGYTADMSKAGRFTAEEVRGWDREPNQVMPIASEMRNAA